MPGPKAMPQQILPAGIEDIYRMLFIMSTLVTYIMDS